MKPLSVLAIVSYRVFPAEMGGQKCVADLYEELSKHTKLAMLAPRENRDTGKQPYPVFPFLFNHWKAPLNIFYLHRIRKMIREQQTDLIIAEHSYFGFFLLLLRWFTKKPIVIRSHNIEAHRFRDAGRLFWRLYGWYEKEMHRRMDHSFFITEEDMNWAITHWQLDPQKCSVLTYGIKTTEAISQAQRNQAKQRLLAIYRLPAPTRLFLFNGSLDYLPNTDALRIILSEILPLLQNAGFPFRILICGKGLDRAWEKVLNANPAILYLGFVEDINPYFEGTDCFISPVTLGSGIRIKMVEALAANQTLIACKSAARGIPAAITGDKMQLVEDYDWQGFAQKMLAPTLAEENPTPEAFYTHFNGERIVRQALLSLQAL
jgi:glycosyltransferase involved in cell wall biosynthesis